jgi:hypothetical protein
LAGEWPEFRFRESDVQHLLSTWRERAAFIEAYGDLTSARLWKLAASELERALTSVAEETLSLSDAAKISGYSINHLGDLIRQGKLPNAGRSGAPRLRRADLPAKNPKGRGRPPRSRLSLQLRRKS